MARRSDAPSRIEILVLSSLARLPMHGYELMNELQYKHVRWWAKCEYGHLYAALARLEKQGFVRPVPGAKGGRERRTYALTAAGRRRVAAALEQLVAGEDSSYFDVDLFLAGAFVLEQAEAVELLQGRVGSLALQLEAARKLMENMVRYAPLVARLIMEHRVEHLEREHVFARRAAEALAREAHWGPFLGQERISDFLARSRAPLEAAR